MIKKEQRNESRKRRHKRIRRKITGTSGRPRLNVYRSLHNIYAQIIDDYNDCTLVSASSLDPEIKENSSAKNKSETAKLVGELIARRAKANDINRVVFDRGGYMYHGRVKSLADAVRKEGIEF